MDLAPVAACFSNPRVVKAAAVVQVGLVLTFVGMTQLALAWAPTSDSAPQQGEASAPQTGVAVFALVFMAGAFGNYLDAGTSMFVL
mmetsp:Transcript_34944/g.105541  ORF Transcript_34944/g.105541 Transcript_34944/m.105541 type:complete len:86 (-) Transcript_34944:531-788(-)